MNFELKIIDFFELFLPFRINQIVNFRIELNKFQTNSNLTPPLKPYEFWKTVYPTTKCTYFDFVDFKSTNRYDAVYFINGLLTENVRLMIKEKCCSVISNTKADKHKYLPFEEQILRYGVAVRVMDFIWITKGSMYQEVGT